MQDNNKQQKIKDIIKKLSDSSADIRQEGLKEATYCADMSVLEAVKNLLNDVNPAVRYYAKKAFGSVSAQISTRAMIEAEENKAREALDGYNDKKSEPEAKQDFISPQVREKIKAIQAVPDAPDDLQAGFLVSELTLTEDKYITATIIKKMGKVGSKSHESYLIPFLSHGDARVIANAVEALDEIGSEEGISEMLKLISHEDNRIKGNITKALYKYLEKDTVSKSLILDKLKNMLNSKEPWTQDSAIFALSSIASQQALDILESYSAPGDSSIKAKIDAAVVDLKRKLIPSFEENEKKAKDAAAKTIKGIDGAVREAKTASTKAALEDAGGFIRGAAEKLWRPGAAAGENAIRLSAALIGGLSVLFVALVFVNILYYLISPARPSAENGGGKTAGASAPSRPGGGDTVALVNGLVESAKYDSALEAVRALKTGGVYTAEQIGLIELIYSKKVQNLVSGGSYDKSLETLSAWQSEYSSSTLACVLKGQIELKHFNRVAEAKTAFSIAATFEADCAEAAMGLGDCFYYEGDFAAAHANYNKALAYCDKLPALKYYAYFGIANSKAALGDYNASIDAYNHTLVLNPDHYITYIGLCKAYRQLKKYDEAIAAAQKALEFDPGLPRANFEYAETLKAAGNNVEALKFYKIALDGEADNFNCRLAYIDLLFSLQIYQGLDEIIKPALKNAPQQQVKALYEKLGMVEYNLHYSQNAKKTFEKMISDLGESDTACYYLGLIYEEDGEFDRAIEYYQKALSANNKHLPSYLNLSNIYLNVKKNYNQLDIIAEVGITNCGNDPGLLYNKALGKYFDQKPAEALLLLRAVAGSNDAFMASMARNLDADIRRKLAPQKKETQTVRPVKNK
jgi:tetratricopeptide (TPR) repeat protein